jgi:Hemerythrin HHE cation binding domain
MHEPGRTATSDSLAQPTDGPDALGFVRQALAASSSELTAALHALDPADRRRQRALDRWFAGFASQLRRHHELVDTMIVPALASRGALDHRALDTMAADHAWIDQLLGDLGDALGVLSFGLGAETWWIGKATDLAGALEHVLTGQLSREQRLLAPLVGRWFDPAERDAVQRETMRSVATGPVRFSLAWLYAHVDATERAGLAAYAPVVSRLAWRSRRGAYERSAVAAFAYLGGNRPKP